MQRTLEEKQILKNFVKDIYKKVLSILPESEKEYMTFSEDEDRYYTCNHALTMLEASRHAGYDDFIVLKWRSGWHQKFSFDIKEDSFDKIIDIFKQNYDNSNKESLRRIRNGT